MVKSSSTPLHLLLSLLFLSPFLILAFQLIGAEPPQWDAEELLWAFRNSFVIALFSALGSLVVGFLAALGLETLRARFPRAAEILGLGLLLPVFLPPFFVLIAFLEWFSFMPAGTLSVSFVHVLVYAGFVAVTLGASVRERVVSLSEVALVFGVSPLRFWWRALPMLKSTIFAITGLVFVLSFTSFSIPLVVGGGRGTTLEILIFEKIRISQDFTSALGLAVVQAALLAFFAFESPAWQSAARAPSKASSRYLGSWVGVFVTALVLFLILGPWLFQSMDLWLRGWRQLTESPLFLDELRESSLRTLGLSLGFVLLIASLSALLILTRISGPLPLLLRRSSPLSTALLGLAGVSLLGVASAPVAYLWALVVLLLPTLVKLTIEPRYRELEPQVQVARVLGASSVQILSGVLWPQLKPQFLWLLTFAFLWSAGDFALARFFFGPSATVALLIENLMVRYRVEGALLLGLGLFGAAAVWAFFLRRLFHVSR